MNLSSIALLLTASLTNVNAFTMPTPLRARGASASASASASTTLFTSTSTSLNMSDEELTQETPEQAQKRIQQLVDDHPVLLFMKGSKIFPQCGFSSTATQILQSYKIDFHTVDVLADENIR